MNLTLADLDPHIADLVLKHGAETRSVHARVREASDESQWTIFAFTTVLVLIGLFTVLAAGRFATLLGLCLILALMLGGGAAFSKVRGRHGRSQRLPQDVRRDALRYVPVVANDLRRVAQLPLGGVTRAEAAYCNIVASLVGAGEKGENDEAWRELLGDMNALLAKSRAFEQQQTDLRIAIQSNTPAQLESERRTLTQRLGAVEDPLAREAMEQALAANETRLQNARAFEQMRARLTAQQEAITQTLASIHSTLVRSRLGAPAGGLAGAAIDARLAAASVSDLATIHEAVTQINNRTRAVEEAAAEVAQLRGGR